MTLSSSHCSFLLQLRLHYFYYARVSCFTKWWVYYTGLDTLLLQHFSLLRNEIFCQVIWTSDLERWLTPLPPTSQSKTLFLGLRLQICLGWQPTHSILLNPLTKWKLTTRNLECVNYQNIGLNPVCKRIHKQCFCMNEADIHNLCFWVNI